MTNLIEQSKGTTPVVCIRDGAVITTSKEVARFFGKRHDDVLKAIRNLLPQLPADHARNFAEMLNTVEIGNGACRKDTIFTITRDGFTLLAMGFTGPRALAFKIAYIDAFNKMEAEIIAKREPPILTHRRWLVSFDYKNQECVRAIGDNEHVVDMATLAEQIREGFLTAKPDYLAEIAQACVERLRNRLIYLIPTKAA